MYYVPALRHPVSLARFDRFFDDAFGRLFPTPDLADSQPARRPAVDVSEDDKQFVVTLDVPGVRRADVDVSVHGRRVDIVAEARKPVAAAKAEPQAAEPAVPSAPAPAESTASRVLVRERLVARYARSFVLPADIDQSGAQARLEDGVLTVTLPKRHADVARLTVN